MLRKLEAQGLMADLSAVTNMLAEAAEIDDPVGHMQFERRREKLQKEIDDLTAVPATSAAVALLFGGRPVIGARGIGADFGARAVEHFQSVLSTKVASEAGPVGARGPVKQRDRAQMMITEVVRGSFGFVLEEQETALLETPLKTSLSQVVDLIYRTSSADEDSFAEAADLVDERVLGSLQAFFRHLDDNGATLKLVDDAREYTLPREAIERARERTENLVIKDRDVRMEGIIYVLPEARRFELHPAEGSTVRGTIATECLKDIINERGEVKSGLLGSKRNVTLHEREVSGRGRQTRFSYTLTAVSN